MNVLIKNCCKPHEAGALATSFSLTNTKTFEAESRRQGNDSLGVDILWEDISPLAVPGDGKSREPTLRKERWQNASTTQTLSRDFLGVNSNHENFKEQTFWSGSAKNSGPTPFRDGRATQYWPLPWLQFALVFFSLGFGCLDMALASQLPISLR